MDKRRHTTIPIRGGNDDGLVVHHFGNGQPSDVLWFGIGDAYRLEGDGPDSWRYVFDRTLTLLEQESLAEYERGAVSD